METWPGVSNATAIAASSALLIVLRWGDDSTSICLVRTWGITTEAPRMEEFECLEPSVYVNVVLSYRRTGVEERIRGGEYECGEGRGVSGNVGSSVGEGEGVVEGEATERTRQPGSRRRRWARV
jgi:hypothetical protein